MRKYVMLISLFIATLAFAAGTMSVTEPYSKANGPRAYRFDCASDASGDCSVESQSVNGYLVGLAVVPDSGGTQPTDQFDLVLNDVDSIDVLDGIGTNMDNSAGKRITVPTPYIPIRGNLTPVLSNMGDTKGCEIVVYIQES